MHSIPQERNQNQKRLIHQKFKPLKLKSAYFYFLLNTNIIYSEQSDQIKIIKIKITRIERLNIR